MTFKDLWKVLTGYTKTMTRFEVHIDYHSDLGIYTDNEELAKIADDDYLGNSIIDDVEIDDGLVLITMTVPDGDMGELDGDSFDLIFN